MTEYLIRLFDLIFDNFLLCIAFGPLAFIMILYALDPGAWDRIREGRSSSYRAKYPPGHKNKEEKKVRSRK